MRSPWLRATGKDVRDPEGQTRRVRRYQAGAACERTGLRARDGAGTPSFVRRLLLAAMLATAVPSAAAQPAPGDGLLAPPPQAEPPQAGSTMPWAQEPAPGSNQRAVEVRTGRPSGFWTSTRPARGGAYRWRILAVGLGVFAITVFFVARKLRRITGARTAAPVLPQRAAR